MIATYHRNAFVSFLENLSIKFWIRIVTQFRSNDETHSLTGDANVMRWAIVVGGAKAIVVWLRSEKSKWWTSSSPFIFIYVEILTFFSLFLLPCIDVNLNIQFHPVSQSSSRNSQYSIAKMFMVDINFVLSVTWKKTNLFCPQWKCIGSRSVNEEAKLCLLLKIVSLQSQMIGYLCFSFISISMSCSSFVSWNWDKMWETKLQHRILCTIVYVQRTSYMCGVCTSW